MTDLRITLRASVFDKLEANENLIYGDLAANPGSTAPEIATRLAKGQVLVEAVLELMASEGTAITGQDIAGTDLWWTAASWADLIRNNRAAARTWVQANDGGTLSAMAAALAVPEPVAHRLLLTLRRLGAYLNLTRV